MSETLTFIEKLSRNKEWMQDFSRFEFYSSSLKQLATKIRIDYAKTKLKNYYV